MKIIELEGDDWKDYSAPDVANKYKNALNTSITYIAEKNNEICGFSRSINDNACEIIVCDLLVTPKFRGQNIGKQLMECIYNDYPDITVYVMSDVDEYYEKIGCRKVGSVFEVIKKTTSATSLMDGCPSAIDVGQLRELGISIKGEV